MITKKIIGNCILYHGDCLDILGSIEDGSIDMIWADPPYGNSNANGDLLSKREKIFKDKISTKLTAIKNDKNVDMKFVVCEMLKHAARVLKKDCCCCCCGGGGPEPIFAWLAQRMDSMGLSFFHSVIWNKLNPGIGWRYRRQHEMIMIAHRDNGKLAWADNDIKQANIVSISKPKDGLHPNEKPIELVKKFIRLHTNDNQVVLDPFMGSGTTGVACAKMGRKFIGIELDKKYFDIACERIDDAYRQFDMFIDNAKKQEQFQIQI